MDCAYCNEPIATDRDAMFDTLPGHRVGNMHRECGVRTFMGSAAHQLRECSCFGGAREDPPGVSLRDGARLAYETYMALNCGLFTTPLLPRDEP